MVEYDDGGQIGRRYRRQDEIGTPWAFTIDEQTLEDDTVTVRERDSLAQERLPLSGVRAMARGCARAAVELAEAMRSRLVIGALVAVRRCRVRLDEDGHGHADDDDRQDGHHDADGHHERIVDDGGAVQRRRPEGELRRHRRERGRRSHLLRAAR